MERVAQETISATLLTTEEQRTLCDRFNDTSVPYPRNDLIQEIFERHADESPDSIALCIGATSITYGELNRTANRIAHHLISLGIKPDDRVGIYAERGCLMIESMLGILKAGGGYVPLDPSYPVARLVFMIGDSQPVAILTQNDFIEHARKMSPYVVDLQSISHCADVNPKVLGLTARNLAYLVYTSGSTGRPKGVMIEHRSVLRLVMNSSYAAIDKTDCVAHCSSPSFDATTWEIWSGLLTGARVLIIAQHVILEPAALSTDLINHGATAMWMTVALFNQYVDQLEKAFGRLRYLLIGGDAVNVSAVSRLLEKETHPRHLVNGYGPTETTTFAITHLIREVQAGAQSIPIGKPIANTRVYVLDRNYQLTPVGMAGEIYIGGDGVARGYQHLPELTAQSFIADAFDPTEGRRLYKTGDLGRWTSKGVVEYLGRSDSQVKIRGFRVEPGEVEIALQFHPCVEQAAVIVHEDESAEKRLVGYVVLNLPLLRQMEERRVKDTMGTIVQNVKPDSDQSSRLLVEELLRQLRCALEESLPTYLVPSLLVNVDHMPLTPNGKINRGELRSFGVRPSTAESGHIAPATDLEVKLSEIWKNLLKVERVGLNDNFFSLGGHSLLATRLFANVEEQLEVHMSAASIFRYPTLGQMAHEVEKQAALRSSMTEYGRNDYEEGSL